MNMSAELWRVSSQYEQDVLNIASLVTMGNPIVGVYLDDVESRYPGMREWVVGEGYRFYAKYGEWALPGTFNARPDSKRRRTKKKGRKVIWRNTKTK